MEVLKQDRNSPVRVGCQVAIVYAVTHGFLNHVEVRHIREYEKNLYTLLENHYQKLLERFESNHWEDEDIATLEKALNEMKAEYER